MYVCMYVCMYICMYVCKYVCMCMYACMYVCMYIYIYVCMYYVCVYVFLVSTHGTSGLSYTLIMMYMRFMQVTGIDAEGLVGQSRHPSKQVTPGITKGGFVNWGLVEINSIPVPLNITPNNVNSSLNFQFSF